MPRQRALQKARELIDMPFQIGERVVIARYRHQLHRGVAARGDTPVELMTIAGNHDSFADLERHIAQLTDFLERALAVR